MRLNIVTRQLVMERKDCHVCDHGTVATKLYVPCPKCNGTGKRGRGRCGNCNRPGSYKPTPGRILKFDHENRSTCDYCNGDYHDHEAEDIYDRIPRAIIESLPVVIVRGAQHRKMTFAEQYLGVGLYSDTDYGAHKQLADTPYALNIAADVAKNRPQACKVVKSTTDHTLADRLLVICADQGYSIIPDWDS